MSLNLKPNIPNLIVMIKPNHFGFNEETAASNSFQHKAEGKYIEEQVFIEFESVIADFSDNLIACHTFENTNENSPDAVFSNNWMASFPNGDFTVYPMYSPNRRAEVRKDIIDWIKNKVGTNVITDLRFEIEKERFLEGTGSIIFDHFEKKAYACESPRTNISLFESHCADLGYDSISFESLDLNGGQIYHTNVMLSIAENYCLVNLDSIENIMEKTFLKLSIEKSGKVVIPISYAQMNCFAANVFEVLNQENQSCLVMSESAYNSLEIDQLKVIQKYSKIVKVKIPTIEKIGGGGIRCMMTGIFV